MPYLTRCRWLMILFTLSWALPACATPTPEPATNNAHTAHTSTTDSTSAPTIDLPPANQQTPPLALPLNPAAGPAIGTTYQAFLSPQQEPGEEKDTPSHIPAEFRSTGTPVLREDRPARGHGQIRFSLHRQLSFVNS
jgi:hypothetical protein